MAFIERFSKITRGELIFTGNSLGLSKIANKNEAGDLGSAGAFTSLDATEQVPTFPKGTTLDYTKNGSSVFLNIPTGSQILYAEIIWSGVYKANQKDIYSKINEPVYFITPTGKYTVNPEHRTKQEKQLKIDNLDLGIYVRSAKVTQLIKTSMTATYSIQGVPSLCEATHNETNFVGWTLVIAFQNGRYSTKRLNVQIGCETVFKDTGNVDVSLAGFSIPSKQGNENKLFISSGEGDANISGDSVYYGANSQNLIKISSENNDANNFFASQINNSEGKLDTTGSFGDKNHNAKSGTNVSSARQGWDITSCDINNAISSNHTNPIVRFTSTGDLYFPNGIGLQANNINADLILTKSVDSTSIKVGDTITYTIKIENAGDLGATNITLDDPFPKELTFVNNSLTIDGEPKVAKFPIKIPDTNPGKYHTVSFQMLVKSLPAVWPLSNIAHAKYNYNLPSGEKIFEIASSNPSNIEPTQEKIEIIKNVDKAFTIENDTLTYTNFITNKGNIKIESLTFFDKPPAGTTFITGSVEIDGVKFSSYNPELGFNLGTLEIGNSITVIFKVTVNKLN